jgi:hypothetical protein
MSVATEVTGFRTAAQPIACKQGSYALRAETHRKSPRTYRSGDEPCYRNGKNTHQSRQLVRMSPASAEGVGVRLADDLPGTGSQT